MDAIVASTADLLRGGDSAERLRLRDIADVADREAEGLPQTDEVHDFLQLLDDLGRFRE
jgi:hypothetical protein